MLRVIVVGLVLAVSNGASAATFSVDVTGSDWQADALAHALRIDLAGHDFVLVDAEALKKKPADVVVRVAFAGTAITYIVAREGMPPVRGASALGTLDRRELANAIIDAMHRLTSVTHDAEGQAAPFALLVLLLGGLAWGAFAAACIPLALPVLVGLHRVEHHELGPALRAWLAVAIQRSLFVALVLAPLVAGVWLAAEMLGLSAVIAWGVVLPIAGLVLRFAWFLVVRLLARRLDAELVDGVATMDNPWHVQVRGYLGGYLGRANLDVDETLVDRLRFYPGRDEEAVYMYAGRVVIGRAILERALAPYGRPHDFAMPRVSTLHWTHWNSGLVMATEVDQKLASREDRDPSKHATVEEGVHERVAIGEPPTFTGLVEPVLLDPRTFYRPGDDPAWLDWDPGDEFDGTDAGDKDFLFGVLVLAMGAMQRHEDRGATVAVWWRRRFGAGRAGLIAKLGAIAATVIGPLRRFAAARSAVLADVHAALAGARHHVAQYHAWRLWRRDDLVTSRAYVPELEATSRTIGATLDRDSDSGDRKPDGGRVRSTPEGSAEVDRKPDGGRVRSTPEGSAEVDRRSAAALRHRLAHLRPFVEPHRQRKRTRKERLVLSFAMLAGIAVVAALAVQAVLYHSTYEQRLDLQRRQHDG